MKKIILIGLLLSSCAKSDRSPTNTITRVETVPEKVVVPEECNEVVTRKGSDSDTLRREDDLETKVYKLLRSIKQLSLFSNELEQAAVKCGVKVKNADRPK